MKIEQDILFKASYWEIAYPRSYANDSSGCLTSSTVLLICCDTALPETFPSMPLAGEAV